MNLLRILLAVAILLVFRAAPVDAQAAPGKLDHQLCYQVKDRLKVNAVADLLAELQPEFSQLGCRVVRATKFCVPVTKRIAQPGSVGPAIVGQPLQNDHVCYRIKCPKDVPNVPDKLVADQFGQRRQVGHKAFELCVPARKGTQPCARLGSAKQCGGACPNDVGGQPSACRFDDATRECTCAPQPCGGKPDAAGQCGGDCTDPDVACRPGFDAAGKPACVCQDPPPPPCGLSSATGTCGGSCPAAADECVLVTTPNGPECICQPPDARCTRDPSSGQCGGECPTGLVCTLHPAINECRCDTPPQECGPNPVTGQCGGVCPPGSDCRVVAATGGTFACACLTP